MEIRIYYESLEQAEYYIKPIIQKSLCEIGCNNYNIKLIEKVQQSYTREGKLSKKYAKKISEILILKNPDLIISIVHNDIEIPISIMEFSTAVFTKDHELQRTDNFNIANLSKAVYIKISPKEKDSGSNGGDTSYNYIEPYAKFYQKYNELAFHINWDIEENNKAVVEKHDVYKSVPKKDTDITILFQLIFKTFIENIDHGNWKNEFNLKVKNNAHFSEWENTLNTFNNFEDITQINTTRMQWEDTNYTINKTNVFTLKLNRLGHAMDPERGMLNYYGTFYKNKNNAFIAKLLFDIENNSWYKDTPKESEIATLIQGGFNSNLELVKAMFLGLSLPNYSAIEKIINNSNDLIIDISSYIEKNILSCNTAFRNIIKNSDILYITDGNLHNIYLTWDMQYYKEYNHNECPMITDITQRDKISEDDVTFATIHSFFKVNQIETLSVSYPGAQSDMPILTEPNNGRKQKRIYIDVIGLKKGNLLFQENKGIYSKFKINSDIDKIIKFKMDREYKKAVVKFICKNDLQVKRLYIGIGFGENSRSSSTMHTDLNLENLDYIFVLSKNMKSWKVFSSIEKHKPFTKLHGNIDEIITYKVN